MLGFLNFLFATGQLLYGTAKQKNDHNACKNMCKNPSEEYATYMDFDGKTRLYKNDHQVVRTAWHGDTVLYDCVTKEVLINYSTLERRKENAAKVKNEMENQERKQKAILKDEYCYMHKDLTQPYSLSMTQRSTKTDREVFLTKDGFLIDKETHLNLGYSSKAVEEQASKEKRLCHEYGRKFNHEIIGNNKELQKLAEKIGALL